MKGVGVGKGILPLSLIFTVQTITVAYGGGEATHLCLLGTIWLHEREPRTIPGCVRLRNIYEPNASYPISLLIYLFYTDYFQGSLITSFIAGTDVGLDQIHANL